MPAAWWQRASESASLASLGLGYRNFLELRFASAADAMPRLDVGDVADLAVILNLV